LPIQSAALLQDARGLQVGQGDGLGWGTNLCSYRCTRMRKHAWHMHRCHMYTTSMPVRLPDEIASSGAAKRNSRLMSCLSSGCSHYQNWSTMCVCRNADIKIVAGTPLTLPSSSLPSRPCLITLSLSPPPPLSLIPPLLKTIWMMMTLTLTIMMTMMTTRIRRWWCW